MEEGVTGSYDRSKTCWRQRQPPDSEIYAKIVTFLWFDGRPRRAAKFYVSIFENSKILSATPMSVTFPARGPTILRPERRAPVQVHARDLGVRELVRRSREVDELWAKLSASKADGSVAGSRKVRPSCRSSEHLGQD